jgi:hypothetical protein
MRVKWVKWDALLNEGVLRRAQRESMEVAGDQPLELALHPVMVLVGTECEVDEQTREITNDAVKYPHLVGCCAVVMRCV